MPRSFHPQCMRRLEPCPGRGEEVRSQFRLRPKLRRVNRQAEQVRARDIVVERSVNGPVSQISVPGGDRRRRLSARSARRQIDSDLPNTFGCVALRIEELEPNFENGET